MRRSWGPSRPLSLTLRLTVLIGIAITLVFVSVGWMVEKSLEHHFVEQDADELKAVVGNLRRILGAVSVAGKQEFAAFDLSHAVTGHHGVAFRVTDRTGREVYATPGVDLSAFTLTQPQIDVLDVKHMRIWRSGALHYRGAVVRLAPDPAKPDRVFLVTAATNMDLHLVYLDKFRRNVWLIAIGASGGAILITALAVFLGLAPIRRISDEIRGIHFDKLDRRLDPGVVPIELAALATAFNDLLRRLQEGVERLSNFSADIAHELRTPITNLTTQTQVALSQSRSIAQYREVLYSNLEEFERMTKMVSDMLFLAQADNDQLMLETVSVDMMEEVRALFEYFEAWAEEQGVELKLLGERVVIPGSPSMLRRALNNLLSNAIRHTASGGTVEVRLSSTPDHAIITVVNPGSDIAPEHLDRLFDRFYRVDPSRQRKGDGAGLGLSIVKSIAVAHRGAASVQSSQGSITFELRLPYLYSLKATGGNQMSAS